MFKGYAGGLLTFYLGFGVIYALVVGDTSSHTTLGHAAKLVFIWPLRVLGWV
jgi:hypothetical protein